ncbi:MAG: metallophosphoesterase [Thermoleophilia bacterium]|nr:metallophosphoesterase [Thermoleophilia bacterium]
MHRGHIAAAVVVAALALPAGAGAATRVLAVGDFGVGGSRQEATGRAIRAFEASHPASLLVTLGDNDYTKGASFESNWKASFGWLARAGVRVAGVLGNHDYERGDRGSYQLEALGMPRRYYTRRAGDVQVFLLDSNEITAAQTRWFRRALRTSKARWKIAAFHHPPWACGGHSGHDEVEERWVPLFERYGVDLVLSGHDHSYQRFAARRGVTYVIHGGGGATLYPVLFCRPGYPRLLYRKADFGFLSIVARDTELRVAAIGLGGRRIDRVIVRP